MVLTNKVGIPAPGVPTIPLPAHPTMQPTLQLPPPVVTQATMTTSPTAGWIPASPCLIGGGMGNLLWGKDSRWLTLDVCREFVRNKCCRSELECRYAHPPPNVEVQNGRVMCCFDSIKGKCQRKDPPCKYLHPPQHLKEQLLQNGRNNLILKHLNMQLLASGFVPAYPSLVYDMSGTLPSYTAPGYTTQLSSINDLYSAGSQYVVASPSSYYSPYQMMPFLTQQPEQQQQHQHQHQQQLQLQQQQVPVSVQAAPRCVAGSVGSTTCSDQGSTGSSDQHTECNSPDDATSQSYQQPACSTMCGTYCGSSADDQAKMGVAPGGGRSIPYSMGGAETCPAPVNLIPCSPYYSPVYLPNLSSYNGSLPGGISPGMAAVKGSSSTMMQDGKYSYENGNTEIDCSATERVGCNGYVMYPVTAPSYAPTTGYAPMAAPTQHLAYLPYPVNGHQYSLPPQFSSPPVMARY